MLKPSQSRVCKTPDLCIIACPYNRILTELGEIVSEPTELVPDDEDATIEVVFDDAAKTKESS